MQNDALLRMKVQQQLEKSTVVVRGELSFHWLDEKHLDVALINLLHAVVLPVFVNLVKELVVECVGKLPLLIEQYQNICSFEILDEWNDSFYWELYSLKYCYWMSFGTYSSKQTDLILIWKVVSSFHKACMCFSITTLWDPALIIFYNSKYTEWMF